MWKNWGKACTRAFSAVKTFFFVFEYSHIFSSNSKIINTTRRRVSECRLKIRKNRIHPFDPSDTNRYLKSDLKNKLHAFPSRTFDLWTPVRKMGKFLKSHLFYRNSFHPFTFWSIFKKGVNSSRQRSRFIVHIVDSVSRKFYRR